MSLRSALRTRIFADVRSKTLFWLAVNARFAVVSRLSTRAESRSGSSHRARPVTDSLAYLERVADDYTRYARREAFTGRLCELGPGDSAGVALLLRARGADSVDLVDRYYSERDPAVQASIYAALAERHDLENLRCGAHWDENALDGIRWWTDRSAETHLATIAAGSPDRHYDAILSRAVLEHVGDPLQVIEQGVQALRPGGTMVHMVDLRDHGYFSREHPELTWLNTPSSLHPWMANACAGPNRTLLHRYRALLDALESSGQIGYRLLVSSLVSVGEIDPYLPYEAVDPGLRERAESAVEQQRSGFAKEFQQVAAQDLAVNSFCLVVDKR